MTPRTPSALRSRTRRALRRARPPEPPTAPQDATPAPAEASEPGAAAPGDGAREPAATEPVGAEPDASGIPTRHAVAGFRTEVGPIAHLQAERERLDALTWDHFDARRLSATVGAVISGVDLTARLDDSVVAELRQALLDYKVIFFRDQPLTPEGHLELAGRFGLIERHPLVTPDEEHPDLERVVRSVSRVGFENVWHTDVSWRPIPAMGALLHATSVPPAGGDTLFADMAGIYDGLPDDIRERVDGLVAVHDFMKVVSAKTDEETLDWIRREHPRPGTRWSGSTGRRGVGSCS
ncbi:MAG: TauD/TfdA family dioxygenase [Iamia sp.]